MIQRKHWKIVNRSTLFVVFLLPVLACSALAAEPEGPFYRPISGFSEALLPILSGFEKASVETTLRGFIARADSFPGYRNSDMEPSDYGLYLNVAVRDADEVKEYSDRSGEKGGVTYRLIQIPAPKGGDQSMVIEFDYGGKASAESVKAIDACIAGVVNFSRKSGNP